MPNYLAVFGRVSDPNTNGKIHSLLARLIIVSGLTGFFLLIAYLYSFFVSIMRRGTLLYSFVIIGLILVLLLSSLPLSGGLFFITLGGALSQTSEDRCRL